MSYNDYKTLTVAIEDGVAHVTINHPPVNVLGVPLVTDLASFYKTVAADTSVAVVIIDSANPDFFIAHADLDFMLDSGGLMALADPDADQRLNPLQQLHESLRNLPQVTIAKLSGRLRAGGVELAMATDMRFAAAGSTWLGQPETRMGIFPGGGGTQYLTRLVGRARALEIVLGADLYDTTVAEQYGWINRAIDPAELDDYVSSLARRIAALPAGVAAAAMEAIDSAEASGPVPHLEDEAISVAKVYPAPDAVVERAREALSAGAQTPDGERDLERLLDSVK